MKENIINMPIDESVKSASSEGGTKDQSAEKKRNQKKSLIKLAMLGILLVIVIIIGSLGWFTANRAVETSGMGVKSAALPFDIATKGANVRNSTVMNAQKPEYTAGTSLDVNNSEGTYYVGDSLLLRFDPARQDDPQTDEDESIPPDISPGSSGELSLYVIPKTNESQKVKVSLNVVAFAEIDDMDNSGEKKIIEIKDASDFASKANAVKNSEAANDDAKYVSAANYLKGHILFFGGEGNISNGAENTWYYYTKPYAERMFEQTVAAGNEGKAVKVPIYWMWTNTLGQIALQTNTNNLRNGIPVVQETEVNLKDETVTDKESILAYLKTNKASVFSGTETITDEMIYAADISENFELLSKQYNSADYEIGTRIAYFMIDVTVEPAS
ncbi:hypothetical protein [Ruminococcus flavefaciens]|uniref:hypothetical protein n=1 Tax=Ruminococcus flavefaciens TaxID=1265 RepID=UPI0026E9B739|nr:hypothetical protein [Ruminococcus flavefaciens]MDD7518166.1 hypothetical protein [Ruminococcus flavefaciens]MDY5690478.1 hypothetical protein [Ruminococcus flavefaciens]